MASYRKLRTGGRSAKAGRLSASPYLRSSFALAALLALASSVFLASQLARQGSKTDHPVPGFLVDRLGAPQASAATRKNRGGETVKRQALAQRWDSKTDVTVTGGTLRIAHGTSSLSLEADG